MMKCVLRDVFLNDLCYEPNVLYQMIMVVNYKYIWIIKQYTMDRHVRMGALLW
jgi:hypothetical protein